MIHARDIPLRIRVLAYIAVLLGYIFYCYNFVVLDYVRPYLIQDIGFSLQQTATFSVAGNIGITVGAFCWASVIARYGRRRSVVIIAATIGLLAATQALAQSFPAFLGIRGLLTASLAGYYVVATSIVVALFPPSMRGKLVALNSAMYPSSNIMVGLLGGALGDENWHILLWLGAAPLLLAPLMFVLVPDDRRYDAYDDESHVERVGSWREMLSARWRWLTIGCIALSGIDFDAYQLFVGFLTVYLKDVHSLSAAQMGNTVALLSTGSLIGGFAWAILTDRFGRRSALFGYVLAAIAILVFLYGELGLFGLRAAAIVYGFGLSCTSAWGAWFAEMFPPHLRPHGAALFHAGHAFALAAPVAAAYASEQLGLVVTMSFASAFYILGAILWYFLPETIGRRAKAPAAVA